MRKASDIVKLLSLTCVMSVFLTACGGGASTEVTPGGGGGAGNGGASASPGGLVLAPEVVAYQETVWKEVSDDKNRCGKCHSSDTNNQAPLFADINVQTAYDAALSFVKGTQVAKLSSPKDSLMVTLVNSGHQPQACWLGSNAACAVEIEALITAWDAKSKGLGVVEQGVQLSPPPIRSAEQSKTFPTDPSVFVTEVHTPYLVKYCSNCHTPTAANPQSPFFASDDISASYLAAQQKMDLLNPANSRFVLRLGDQFHNCWTSTCTDDAAEMEVAITKFADSINLTQVDPNLIISKALTLQPPEAIVASGGERHAANQIALWEFKNIGGDPAATTAFDTSGVDPKINLSLSGNYNWVGGYGVQFNASGFDGRAQATTESSKKLLNNLLTRDEYSIEAWVIPANVAQMDRNIISYSAGSGSRNFTIAQNEYHYQFHNRSTTGTLDVGSGINGINGGPALESQDEDLQASQQHIVMTFDKVNGRRMYVNGVWTEDVEGTDTGGLLDNWNSAQAFILANENGVFDDTRAWKGTFRMVAVHNRVLTDEQIDQNFKAGVGEKYFLLFSISHIDGVPADSYIKVQAEQYDTYGYLFNNPVYINLGSTTPPINFPIKGMRIGINGKEAIVGQSFIHLTDDGSNLNVTTNNQEISRLGSVIQLQRGPTGPTADDFFLSFEVLGNESNTFVVAKPIENTDPIPDLPAQSDIGVRTFSEINGTMSALTGVPTSNNNVLTKYKLLSQQMPSTESMNAFGPGNIIAISQLAFEYCDRMVEDTSIMEDCDRTGNTQSARSCMFGAFDTRFASVPSVAFDQAGRDLAANALYDRMIGVPDGSSVTLINAPSRTDVTDELINATASAPYPGNLVTRLINAGGSTTNDITKAMCTAVLGSAAMLVQ